MGHKFSLEAPICVIKDSFEILRFSAFIWAQEKGHFYAETVEKILFEVYQFFVISVILGCFNIYVTVMFPHISQTISVQISYPVTSLESRD